jgi:type 1 fimbria pilin
MKLLKRVVLISTMGCALSAMAENINEGSGSINFTGAIIEAPCSVNPGSIEQTVDLGQVSSSSLMDEGKSPKRDFEIKLENCNLEVSSVTTTFTGPAGEANGGNSLKLIGTASGAGIVIVDGDEEGIELGKPTDAVTIQKGNNTLKYSAYLQGNLLMEDEEIIPGDFTSHADYTLSYN